MPIETQFRCRPELRNRLACKGQPEMFKWSRWKTHRNREEAEAEAAEQNQHANGPGREGGVRVFEYRVKKHHI